MTSTNTSMVKWETYDVETADKEKEELDKSGGGEFMKLAVGRNIIRFMPPKLGMGMKSPFLVVYEHYIEHPDLPDPVRFACPQSMAKKPCPSCRKAHHLRSTGNPEDRNVARDYFPSRRVYSNVINRQEPEKGPVILSFGKKIHDALVTLRRDPDAGGDFTHPETGFDIIIERTGTGKNDTKYAVLPARQASPLGNLEWIDSQTDLRRFTEVLSEEQIIALFKKQGDGEKPAYKAPPQAPPAPSRTVGQDVHNVDPNNPF